MLGQGPFPEPITDTDTELPPTKKKSSKSSKVKGQRDDDHEDELAELVSF